MTWIMAAGQAPGHHRRPMGDDGESTGEAGRTGARVEEKPLLYSCSGCSSAAQLANHLALRLDRRGVGEMSCIAGVGGDVPSLVKVATSGRPVVALDGCPLHCVKGCLARHGVEPTVHLTLSEYGVKRRKGEDFDPDAAAELLERFGAELTERFGRGA